VGFYKRRGAEVGVKGELRDTDLRISTKTMVTWQKKDKGKIKGKEGGTWAIEGRRERGRSARREKSQPPLQLR